MLKSMIIGTVTGLVIFVLGMCLLVAQTKRNLVQGDTVGVISLSNKEVKVIKTTLVTDIPLAFSTKVKGEYYVVINQVILDLPVRQSMAILFHEVGHIQLGHLDSNISLAVNNIQRHATDTIPRIEKEADTFAILLTSAKDLKEALASINIDNDKEVTSRINSL
ncbi:MAG: hypothetical protein DRI98_13905 [Bacteroidetes bacterium]|nr:MAG: hypothetical protein DRI98_13905 [Bacteroidota bacterium]